MEDYRAGGGGLADCLGQLVALVGSDHVARSLQAAAAAAGQVRVSPPTVLHHQTDAPPDVSLTLQFRTCSWGCCTGFQQSNSLASTGA